MFTLWISFPLGPNWPEESDKVIKLVGVKPSGAGAGFGQRDMDFRFDTEAKANSAADRCRAAGYKVTVTGDDPP